MPTQKKRAAMRDAKTGRFLTATQIEERGPCHCGGPRDDETKRTCSKCRARASAFGKRRTEKRRAERAEATEIADRAEQAEIDRTSDAQESDDDARAARALARVGAAVEEL